MMVDFADLLITNNDLTLDPGGEPLLIYDQDCIAQDIKHMILDSGLLIGIVGLRDHNKIKGIFQRLVLLIESDIRLIPGTVKITNTELEIFNVAATSYKYGGIALQVSA